METIRELVDQAIELEKEIKEKTKKLNERKAKIQAEGLRELENKNIRSLQYFGEKGFCTIGYKQKMEVDNYGKLVDVLGDVVSEKTTKTEEIKYDFEKQFKLALIHLYLGDYKEHDLEKILQNHLNITEEKQRRRVLKKLKGEYAPDKKLLESVGVVGVAEEELDAVREQKNWERIIRFFDVERIDREELKNCIFVEDTLSIGLSYEK